MDFVIEELIIEEDRPEHFAKHGVEITEVLTLRKNLIANKLARDNGVSLRAL